MSHILLTGGTGFLGGYLVKELLAQGHQVHALVRDPAKCPEGCQVLQGDVTQGMLGIDHGFEELWNAAGVIDLSKKAKEATFAANTGGVRNVIDYALTHGVKRIVHISTAYAEAQRNPYEVSKWWGDRYLEEIGTANKLRPVLPVVVLKPSILVAEWESGAIADGKPGAFYEFVRRLLKVHAKLERMRKAVEGKLHLHPWDFHFCIRGDPEATLNLIPVDIAAREMIRAAEKHEAGTFYITNPEPPKLADLAEWVGEVVRLQLRFDMNAVPYPLEMVFNKVIEDFAPYLKGEPVWQSALDFPVPVDRYYIRRTLAYLMGKSTTP